MGKKKSGTSYTSKGIVGTTKSRSKNDPDYPARRIMNQMRAFIKGKNVVLTKGIGSGEIGAFLRQKILLQQYTDENMNEIAFPLALMDCARDSINALKDGNIVITDRFIGSYFAYSADSSLKNKLVRHVEKYVHNQLPNKYIIGELFIDSTVESCVKRIKNRGTENFLDNSPIEKFQKINDSFKDYFDDSNNLFYEINNRGSLAGLYQQLDKFINANIII